MQLPSALELDTAGRMVPGFRVRRGSPLHNVDVVGQQAIELSGAT